MKLVSYYFQTDVNRQLKRGVLLDGGVLPVTGDFNALGETDLANLQAQLERANGAGLVPLEQVQLGAPLPNPPKIICVGLNYSDHAEETGMTPPPTPLLFAKWSNTLIGPDAPVFLDGTSQQVDYEAELVFVIGKPAYKIPEEHAFEYIAGYMCANDVSARDLQFATPGNQWSRSKSLDGFCPIGPYLATSDEIPDPHNLRIACRVNQQTLQDSNTSKLIFKIPTLLSFLSQGMTLQPGDIVLTGTPAGVGFTRKPPLFLKPGDVCEIEIEGLGTLRNNFVER